MSFEKLKHYITPEGAQSLRDELKWLWKDERPEWTSRVSAAAKEGDRSENAEYIYSKKKLREIDRRIRYLTKTLDHCIVVREKPTNQNNVFFGAFVELESDKGVSMQYQIVGTAEFDLNQGKMSIMTPLARALLGKQVDDEVEITVDGAVHRYCITKIHYV